MTAPENLIPDHKYGNWGVQEHLCRYDFAAKYVLGKEVLDTGCGFGDGSVILSKAGAKLVQWALSVSSGQTKENQLQNTFLKFSSTYKEFLQKETQSTKLASMTQKKDSLQRTCIHITRKRSTQQYE